MDMKEKIIEIIKSNLIGKISASSDVHYVSDDNIDEIAEKIEQLFTFGYNDAKVDSNYRGCCEECGEGYDNEPEWKYNTKCEICGHPIPKDKIIKKPKKNGKAKES